MSAIDAGRLSTGIASDFSESLDRGEANEGNQQAIQGTGSSTGSATDGAWWSQGRIQPTHSGSAATQTTGAVGSQPWLSSEIASSIPLHCIIADRMTTDDVGGDCERLLVDESSWPATQVLETPQQRSLAEDATGVFGQHAGRVVWQQAETLIVGDCGWQHDLRGLATRVVDLLARCTKNVGGVT